MIADKSRLRSFLDNFGKLPEGEPREFIPPKMRMRVFLGMVVASVILLALLLWLVVIPAIKAQSTSPHAGTSAPLRSVRA